MNLIYLLLIPIFLFTLYKKVAEVVSSVKQRNSSKLKADVFFLVLTLAVFGGTVFLIETN